MSGKLFDDTNPPARLVTDGDFARRLYLQGIQLLEHAAAGARAA